MTDIEDRIVKLEVLQETQEKNFSEWKEQEKSMGKDLANKIWALEKKMDTLVWKIFGLVTLASGAASGITAFLTRK